MEKTITCLIFTEIILKDLTTNLNTTGLFCMYTIEVHQILNIIYTFHIKCDYEIC